MNPNGQMPQPDPAEMIEFMRMQAATEISRLLAELAARDSIINQLQTELARRDQAHVPVPHE